VTQMKQPGRMWEELNITGIRKTMIDQTWLEITLSLSSQETFIIYE